MNEFRNTDVNEYKPVESSGFIEIKPEEGTTINEARSYVDSLFTDVNEQQEERYTDYKDRVDKTPQEISDRGEWTGERGESKYIPNSEMDDGKLAADRLEEKGLDGIEYKNGEADFSKCAEATVEIQNMTEDRFNHFDSEGNLQKGNFAQADEKCAEKWNAESKDGRNDWSASDVRTWRHDNNCSWHERCDTKSMDLVSRDIHGYFPHSGGVAECKVRDRADNGGGFDE